MLHTFFLICITVYNQCSLWSVVIGDKGNESHQTLAPHLHERGQRDTSEALLTVAKLFH